jgi:hypothetical protein
MLLLAMKEVRRKLGETKKLRISVRATPLMKIVVDKKT